MFSAYHMSPTNLNAYVDELRRRRPLWLHGYPSLLALLAGYMVDRDMDVGYQVRWVTTGAENLLPHQASVIQRAFGVRATQHYGMAEASANISECERGRLHVDEDFCVVEFRKRSREGEYAVIGSSVSNRATGLLRYDVGDVVVVGNEGCECERPGRVVSGIDGREEDYIVLGSGARVSCANQMFKWITDVREAQMHQRRAGEVTVRVVRGKGYDAASEDRIVHALQQRMGTEFKVEIDYVDAVERSATGKLRLVISEVGEGSLGASG